MEPTTDGAIERANQMISAFLKNGPHSAREILAATQGANVSRRTIQRAAEQMGVEKTKAEFNGGWRWRLPTDEVGTTDSATERPAQVAAKVEDAETVKNREIPSPPDAKVIASRLRRLEEIRGKKAPIYAEDSRVMRWVELGIRDPALREAYERAVTALEDTRSQAFVTVGLLDPFVMQVLSEGDKA